MRKYEDKTNGISGSRMGILEAAISDFNSRYSDVGTITFRINYEEGEIAFVPKSVRYVDSYDVNQYADRMADVLGVLKCLTSIYYNLNFDIPDEELTHEEFSNLVNEVLYNFEEAGTEGDYDWERSSDRITKILYSIYSDYQEDDDE